MEAIEARWKGLADFYRGTAQPPPSPLSLATDAGCHTRTTLLATSPMPKGGFPKAHALKRLEPGMAVLLNFAKIVILDLLAETQSHVGSRCVAMSVLAFLDHRNFVLTVRARSRLLLIIRSAAVVLPTARSGRPILPQAACLFSPGGLSLDKRDFE